MHIDPAISEFRENEEKQFLTLIDLSSNHWPENPGASHGPVPRPRMPRVEKRTLNDSTVGAPALNCTMPQTALIARISTTDSRNDLAANVLSALRFAPARLDTGR